MTEGLNDTRIPDVVGVAEAAKLLGVTGQTVRELWRRHEIPGRRVGAAGLIFRRVVVEATARRRAAP